MWQNSGFFSDTLLVTEIKDRAISFKKGNCTLGLMQCACAENMI